MKRASLAAFLGGLAIAGATALSAYVLAVRPWHLRWGATDEEANRYLPGDDLVPHPKLRATHAITVRASASEVWPWLAQIGQGRGGFYSYDWLENLAGLNIHSADRIIPEFQHLTPGDEVPFAPGFGIPVHAVEPGRALVLHGDTRDGSAPAQMNLKPGDYLNTSWTFFLEQQDDGTTRLIERFQADYNPSPRNTIFNRLVLEPGSFIMEQKMLRGIKERAEQGAQTFPR